MYWVGVGQGGTRIHRGRPGGHPGAGAGFEPESSGTNLALNGFDAWIHWDGAGSESVEAGLTPGTEEGPWRSAWY